MTAPSEPIAVLRVAPLRRALGLAVQAGLAAVLIYAAVTLRTPSPVVSALLALCGGAVLWQARRVFAAGGKEIRLTREGLFDSAGTVIARLEDIEAVECGIFTLRPSNGFALRLNAPAPRAWVPGLWWRVGTRVGVGGATSGAAARQMADLVSLARAGRI